MRRKSKFLTFILSFIPGLGHIYLGKSKRGGTFLFGFVGACVLGAILAEGVSSPEPLLIILFSWLVSLVDSMTLVDDINNAYMYNSYYNQNGYTPNYEGNAEEYDEYGYYNMELKKKRHKKDKKATAMVLSFIPGAGHMYIGLRRKGIELMAAFFIAFYLTDLTQVAIFALMAPVIWFYSMFDVRQEAVLDRTPTDEDLSFVKHIKNMDQKGKRKLGIVLVGIGALILFQRIVVPILDMILGYRFYYHLRTIVISLIFIYGGIKLINKNVN